MNAAVSRIAVVAAVILASACDRSQPTAPGDQAAGDALAHRGGGSGPATMTVVATGLTNPRGFAFRHHDIYVAEAGTGGTISTIGQCTQLLPPVGPMLSGRTGRISRIDAAGNRTTVVDGLPSSASPMPGFVLGPNDVAFLGSRLYALLDAGCSHAVPDVPASVALIHDGSFSVAANLSDFVHANPVARPEAEDFEPDGDWYSMIATHGALYAIDANGGQLVQVKPKKNADRTRITRVVDISASQGHIVPTAATPDGSGGFYVGNLGTFPSIPGTSSIFHVSRKGQLTMVTTGLQAITGIARTGGGTDADDDAGRPEGDQAAGHGALYVLESFTCPGVPTGCAPGPTTVGTGQVVRVLPDGTQQVVVSGLTFPTSLRVGPDGALYVATMGYGSAPGAGAIVRITLPH